ncbi:inositol monophosphatase family protein [Maricaulis sp.]|uniref:inositol monophosphatase family protein n=1 Tax=Maricaulis sp. TaxID=1486257 RepID=UPI00262C6DD8|nr:inositol monophosphatase family protein [Maricaulis sp.]
MPVSDLPDLLDFARHLAVLAEREIMPRFRRGAVAFKADGSEVTEADKRAETVMREAIAKAHPSAGFLGEETGRHAGTSEDCWIVDPIDGTTYFALGMPLFGTLVALTRRGQPVLGVIALPAQREVVYAAEGLGCWRKADDAAEAQRLRTAPGVRLADAFVSSAGLHASEVHPHAGHAAYSIGRLAQRSRKLRFLGDCGQHALLCAGRIDLAVDAIMAPWDAAAIIPCVREAGGLVASLAGERDGLIEAGSLVSASSDALLGEFLALAEPGAAGSSAPASG